MRLPGYMLLPTHEHESSSTKTCSLTLANYDLQKPLLTKIIVSSKIFQFGRIKRKVLDKLFLRSSSLVSITRKVIGQAHL